MRSGRGGTGRRAYSGRVEVRGRAVAGADLAMGGFAVGALAVAGLGATTGWRATDGPVLCPFRLLTGYPCPLCGITRSVAALGAGDVEAGLALNPLGVAVLPLAVVVLVLVVVAFRRGIAVRWRRDVVLTSVVVAVGVWLLGLVGDLQ